MIFKLIIFSIIAIFAIYISFYIIKYLKNFGTPTTPPNSIIVPTTPVPDKSSTEPLSIIFTVLPNGIVKK